MAWFSWFSREKSRDPATRGPSSPEARKFAAAAIVPGSDACCSAVREIAWKRFLTNQVPMIPLRDCDLAKCSCTYRRYPDRRQENRRAAAANMGGTGQSPMIRQQGDRRSPSSPGRRATDTAET